MLLLAKPAIKRPITSILSNASTYNTASVKEETLKYSPKGSAAKGKRAPVKTTIGANVNKNLFTSFGIIGSLNKSFIPSAKG